jgi:hypothetical protein
MNNLDRYKKLPKKGSSATIPTITAFIPTPDNTDYKRGYIQRYFVTKTNETNGIIYEVSDATFLSVIKSPLYKGVRLRWRLIGSDVEVSTSNSKSITIASEKIKHLKLYLPNLLQFHK